MVFLAEGNPEQVDGQLQPRYAVVQPLCGGKTDMVVGLTLQQFDQQIF